MRNRFSVLLLGSFLCCTTASIRDRGNDAADVVGMSLDFSLGAEVSVSALTVGAYTGGSGLSTFNGSMKGKVMDGTWLFGAGCSEGLHFERLSVPSDDSYYVYRNKKHCQPGGNMQPYDYGRIRVRAGLILGVTLEINLFEIGDFFAGLLGRDLFDDDWNGYYDRLRTKKMETEKNSKTDMRLP